MPRPHPALLVASVALALAACTTPGADHRDPPRATGPSTTTGPLRPSGLGEPVTLDPQAQGAQPAVIEAIVPTGPQRLAVAVFLLPCQQLRTVGVRENRSQVTVHAELGWAVTHTTAASRCPGRPRLVHTVVELAGPLAGRELVAE